MNGRLRTTSESQQQPSPAPSDGSVSPLTHTQADHPSSSAPLDRLQSPRSAQFPDDSEYSSPSNYPSPSPGFQDQDPANRPESSAQGAARFRSNSPPVQPRSDPDEPTPMHPSSSSSNQFPSRPSDHTNDTFGRTSGKSAISETQGSSTSRRKASPTERAAFGYLASSWIRPSGTDQSVDITKYRSHGSESAPRKEVLDALEKELNLSDTSSPLLGTSSGEEDGMWTTGTASGTRPSGASLRPPPRQSLLSRVAGSVTPDRTFGQPSVVPNRARSASPDSKAGQDDSRPSQSDTVSSRGTHPSQDIAYGVGEAGGDQQFTTLTRVLNPEQQRQQEELECMSQQRVDIAPASPSNAFDSRLVSPLTARDAQRASQQSNTTILATNTTSASVASSSTPQNDVRFGRHTHETTSSGVARLTSYSEQHAFGHQPLFVGEAARSGSRESIDVLKEQSSPQIAQGPAPARAASVRVKTPMFGNTLTELPPEQRVSMYGALNEKATAPYSPRTDHSIHNVNPNLNTEANQAQNAQHDPQQSYAAQQHYSYQLQSQPGDQQYQTTHAYYTQSAEDQNQPMGADHAYMYQQILSRAREDAAYTPHLPNLGDMYAVAPRFPPAPYSGYRDLRMTSRLARVHHTILPLITYAHIPATLFLDYNVIFALVQIALYPDTFQVGARTAWWIVTGIYGGCVLIWIVGVLVIYERLWSFNRRWIVPQPLVMPVYLSAPAFARTAMKDYSLYSLLYRARTSSTRRDAFIEAFWYYSQNWPTVVTLLPRGVISAILLVLYKPDGPARPTQSPRDPAYFNADTQRFTQFAFIPITFQAAWTAWKLGVLLIANIGLIVTLGWKSLVQKEKDTNAIANTEMMNYLAYYQPGIASHGGDAIEQPANRRWAWRLRAEDRIRAILFDAGLLHQPLSAHDWQKEHKAMAGHPGDYAAEQTEDRGIEPIQVQPMVSSAEGQGQQGAPRDWFGQEFAFSQSQTGLALTSPEAVQPEEWEATQSGDNVVVTAMPAPPVSQSLHVHHVESSPSQEGGDVSDASDPYSPAPLPIGRSPRSKEQLRDASSISSRRDSARASSISSLNRLAAMNVANSSSVDSQLAEGAVGGATPVASQLSQDLVRAASLGSAPAAGVVVATTTPTIAAAQSGEGSSDTGLLHQWRGRKRPRSSPILAHFPVGPQSMIAETENWLQGQIDEDNAEEEEEEEQRRVAASSSKPGAFDNNRRVMHTLVPMPASFAMSKDPSMTGSPDQGGSDTKHGSWTAAAPNLELLTTKRTGSNSTLPLQQPSDGKSNSTTSLGSSLKDHRSGTYSRPRSTGYEFSSEDGVSMEGAEGGKRRSRHSFLGMMTPQASSDGKRRSGSGGKVEGESWITALFGGRSASRKASAGAPSSSPVIASSDSPRMQPSSSTSRSDIDPQSDNVPTVITTSASISFPTTDSGSIDQHTKGPGPENDSQTRPSGSLLLSPITAAAQAGRSASPSGSVGSNASSGTEDSEEGRLWASFPEQSRRHPPGLIALDLEQRTLAERRLAAAAAENNAHYANSGASGSLSQLINMSPLLHPNVLAAIQNGSPLMVPGVLAGAAGLSVSPSEGGLQAIREESWTSSLDSRSQAASGSTRSQGTGSVLTASPVDADFPLEQIEEVAVPHPTFSGSSSGGSRASRPRRVSQ